MSSRPKTPTPSIPTPLPTTSRPHSLHRYAMTPLLLIQNTIASLTLAVSLFTINPALALDNLTTVSASEAVAAARSLPKQDVKTTEIWLLLAGGSVGILAVSSALENTPLFPAIARANRAQRREDQTAAMMSETDTMDVDVDVGVDVDVHATPTPILPPTTAEETVKNRLEAAFDAQLEQSGTVGGKPSTTSTLILTFPTPSIVHAEPTRFYLCSRRRTEGSRGEAQSRSLEYRSHRKRCGRLFAVHIVPHVCRGEWRTRGGGGGRDGGGRRERHGRDETPRGGDDGEGGGVGGANTGRAGESGHARGCVHPEWSGNRGGGDASGASAGT